MQTTKGKLRNITSGILHTTIGDVYTFFEEYLGAKGIMTHQLPSAGKSIVPILKSKLSAEWFINEWQKEGLSEKVEIDDLTETEKADFWKQYDAYAGEMWNSIKDKSIVVQV